MLLEELLGHPASISVQDVPQRRWPKLHSDHHGNGLETICAENQRESSKRLWPFLGFSREIPENLEG